MNEITLIYQGVEPVPFEEGILNFTKEVFKKLDIDNWEISLTISDNSYIREINRDYREKDKPTDVITFVMADEPFPTFEEETELYSAGDMIISLEYIEENSKYFKVSFEEELKRVIIHGILHLKGMDHKTNEPTEDMLIYQEKVLQEMGTIGIF